ncbi:hypothetical protein QVM41_26215 [Pseudomonas shirazica]|uniref:hypothetical protein n=1 Tax=Pseudomonas shirazica TaxID=1940636 RepID=UPI0035266DDA
MLTVLSLLDDRLRPKGSRDPLAIESIWSAVGRKLVGNLTTVTSRADHFIVALLACRYAHEGSRSCSLDDIQERYARAEQLAAYLRLDASVQASLLGRQLAVANFRRDSMALGMHKKAQILSNQLSYGLWGLYSSALQEAGLIKGSDRRLTGAGIALTDALLDTFGLSQWQRFGELASQGTVRKAQLSPLAGSFAALLDHQGMRKQLVSALLRYAGARPLQLALYEAVQQWLPVSAEQPASARLFARWAVDAKQVDAQVQDVLRQILSLQPLLVFANTVVVWLQMQNGRTRSELVKDLRSRLGAPFIHPGWDRPGLPHARFLQCLTDAANDGDAGRVIHQLMEQNSAVTGARGGAAWLHWEGDRLRVRVPVDRTSLPEDLAAHCHQAWDYSFFLHAFLAIAKAGHP